MPEQEGPSAASGPEPLPGEAIRCICQDTDDDGFTICCDKCLDWQHALCVNVDVDNIPETYVCEKCDPKPEERPSIFNTDPTWARERQILRKQAEAELKQFDSLSEQELTATARAVAYGHITLASIKEERKKKKRKSLPAVETRATRGQPPTPSNVISNDLLMGSIEDDEEFQSWQFEFTPIEHPKWVNESLAEHVRATLQDWFSRQRLASSNDDTETLEESPRIQYTVSFQRSKLGHIKWQRKRLKANSKTPIFPPKEDFLDYDEAEDVGILPPIGVAAVQDLPEPRVAVKPIHSHTMSLAPPLSLPFATSSGATPSQSCPYPRALSYGLFAQGSIQEGSFICHMPGEILTVEQYRSNPANQYKILGLPKPGVRGVGAPWCCYIDARQYGSEARFVRSGCHPNAAIRPFITKVKATSARGLTENFELGFALFALTDISKRDEIVLPWDWDDDHIVHILPALLELPTSQWVLEPSPDLSRRMAAVSATLLSLTTCACEKRKDCAVGWLWKLACSSQPSGLGGGNRREVESDEVIKERMATSLGTGLPAKKGARGKKPDLGVLMELTRGFVNLPRPVEVEKERHSPKKASPSPEAKIASPLPSPTQRKMDVDVHDPQTIQIFEDPLPTSVPTPIGTNNAFDAQNYEEQLPSPQPGIMDVQDHFTPTGAAEEQPMETVAQSDPVPPKEPSPEPAKEPTPPPPPPPRAKLSFAAYRKRKSEKAPDLEQELSGTPITEDSLQTPLASAEPAQLPPPQSTPAFSPPPTAVDSPRSPVSNLSSSLRFQPQSDVPYSPKLSRTSSEEPNGSPIVQSLNPSPIPARASTYSRPLDFSRRSPARRASPSPERSPPPSARYFPPARPMYSTPSYSNPPPTAPGPSYFPSASSLQYSRPQMSYGYRSPSPLPAHKRQRTESPVRSPSPRPRSPDALPLRDRSMEARNPLARSVDTPPVPTGPRGIYNRFPGRGGANVRGRGLNLMPFQTRSQESNYAPPPRRPAGGFGHTREPTNESVYSHVSRDSDLPPTAPKAYSRPSYPPREPLSSVGRRPITPPRSLPTGPAADRFRREYSPDRTDSYRPPPREPMDSRPSAPRGPARGMATTRGFATTRGYYAPRGAYRGRGRN